MIIYNVTITLIDEKINEKWLEWMKTKHIKDVMNTGCFKSFRIFKLIEKEEITYAIQYECENMIKLNKYQKQYSQKLQKEHTQKFKGKFGAFRTLLEVICE